jgi:hypothetical protein
MQTRTIAPSSLLSSSYCILVAAALATSLVTPVRASAPESMTPELWRIYMANHSAEEEGCFHASFPNTAWERVDCEEAPAGVHPVHISRAGAPEVAGSGDYVAQTANKITWAGGGFATSGLTSEVGVAEYVNNEGQPLGVLGPDQYSIQLNTNEWGTTSACQGRRGCHVWQQFVYANHYPSPSSGGKVFMQYWLLDWGSSACPSGWTQTGTACFENISLLSVPSVPVTQLDSLSVAGGANHKGLDSVTFSDGNEFWTLTRTDSILDISSVWDKAEFNVVGNAGGAQAQFNPGTSIVVTLLVADGVDTAPTCLADGGTTGESNNLSVGPCTTSKAFIPHIQYTESN